jgi:hypothetical protein
MSKGERSRAEREARQIAHAHNQRDEGRWLGEVSDNAVANELIRHYNEASKDLRACPHLHEDWDQARFWVDAVPELLSCKACTSAVAAEEKQRRNSCCVMCGEHVRLRGMSVTAGGLLLRGGICELCEDQHGGLMAA